MKHRATILALALVAACAGDKPTGPSAPRVSTVTVGAPSTSVVIGDQLQATATVKGSDGATLSNVPVSWSSSDITIASVSTTGLVTALAEGGATIRATAGGVVGQLAITVTRAVTGADCGTPLALQPGEVRVLSGVAAVSCITVASSAAPTDYLFIAANGSTTQDDVGSYFVSGSLASVATASLASSSRALSASPNVAAPIAPSVQDAFEARLRQKEARRFAGISPAQLARAAAPARARASVATAALSVGDTISYRVPDANGDDLCNDYSTVRAVVRAIGQRAEVVEDVSAPKSGFTPSDYQAIVSEFDGLIYATDTSWFGGPSDINGDGHITILYSPEINKLTPKGSQGFVAGFFWGGDLLPRSVPSQHFSCPASNEQEIFYLLVPDPAGSINSNVRSTSTVRQGTRGTIAHEFQHMINDGIRQASPTAGIETSWLNEALSHFAEEAVGRAARGFGDEQTLTYHDVTGAPADYNAFFAQNLLRFRSWMQHPDTSSPVSQKTATQLAPRGAAWALVRYAADRYSHGNPRAFTRALVAGPEVDVANLVARAGVPFDDLLSGFLVANFTTGLGVQGLAPRWTYASWDMRDAMTGVGNGNFPLYVVALPTQLATRSLAGSGNYFRLTRLPNAPAATFRMQATSAGGPVAFPTARVYVVRLS